MTGAWWARTLLRLYSPSFRRRYGAEAVEVVAADLEAIRGASPWIRPLRTLAVLAAFGAHGVVDRVSGGVGGGALGGWAGPGWRHDLRSAVRGVVRRPVFAVVAVVSLAVGIAANTTAFALVDALMLQEIAGATGHDRIVELSLTRRGSDAGQWDWPTFTETRDATPSLAAMALAQPGAVSLVDDAAASDRLMALYVTSAYFETLGVALARGRSFDDAVDVPGREAAVVVLSHGVWQTRFAGDPDILGRTVRINREPHTVVGVAPPAFRGHQFGAQPALYLPLTRYPPARADPQRFFGTRSTGWANALGRLTPGATVEGLQAALGAVTERVARAAPDDPDPPVARAAPARPVPAEARAPMAAAFALLTGLMLLVLAATAANVAGMLLARAAERTREMALRLALGSGRGRLVRHLVAEAFVVFALGGVLGFRAASWAVPWVDVDRWVPTPFPVDLGLAVDTRAFAFTFLLTMGGGLLFGLLPALQVVRGDLASNLRDTAAPGHRSGRLRTFFVGAQVGVAALLLVSAGLFVRSLAAGAAVEPGFEPAGVYTTRIDLALEGRDDPAEAAVFVSTLLRGLRSDPAIEAATVATDVPLDGGSSSAPFRFDDADDGAVLQSHWAQVSDGYFETLDIPVVLGRGVTELDGPENRRVAVVNETFARTAWPEGGALGHTLRLGLEPHPYEVVGVVGDTGADLVTDAPSPQVFTALAQAPAVNLHVVARARTDDPAFAARFREAVLDVDPALALGPVRALDDLTDLGLLPQRIVVALAGGLGLLALFLAALGVYGVVAHGVARRTREIGVRMALGARRRRVVMGVLGQGIRLVLPGLAAGALLALALTGVLRSLLVGIGPADPVAWGGAVGLLLGVVVVACILPARRASAVAPADALRSE